MNDYEEERDEPALLIDISGDERVKKKLDLFRQYIEENNGEFPDTFFEDIDRLYASVDREFDAQL